MTFRRNTKAPLVNAKNIYTQLGYERNAPKKTPTTEN